MPDFDFTGLAPKKAIDHFRKKGYKIGFHWQDIQKEEHAHAFTVAKAMRNDILQDIRSSVDKVLSEGIAFEQFKKELKPVLQSKGWWGKQEVIDPLTGEKTLSQLGSTRRLKTIFDTNLRTAYAAGRWERIQRVKNRRPYLRYVIVDDDRTRDAHRKFNDIILHVDHPFWNKFYPPNGWKCRCSVQQLSTRQLERLGLDVTDYDPTPPNRIVLNKRTGEILKVPQGISAGFDYNVGVARMKAMVPRPINKPDVVPYIGDPAKVGMPDVRHVPKKILLDENLSEEDYAKAFLSEFGADIGKPAFFKDVTGDVVTISESLFQTASGRWKIAKDMRHIYLGMLAKTIKDPDEIWLVWEEYPKGRMTLRRKYLSRFDVEGAKEQAFILFDTNRDGWNGVTAFKPKRSAYLDKQRNGALIYRRED